MGTWTRILALLFAAAIGAANASTAAPQPGAAAKTARATQLIGHELFEPSGKLVGRIDDLLIEQQQNRLAALSVSGASGNGEIALDGARLSLRKEGGVIVDPPISPSKERGLALRRASEMMRAQLRERDGKPVAQVKDLIVRLDDRALIHLVVEFDPAWHDQPGWIALPVTSVEPEGAAFIARFKSDDIRPAEPGAVAAAKPAAPAAPAAPPKPSLEPEARLSRVLGASIVARDGPEIGKVADVVVDASKRSVTHLLVDLPGAGHRRVMYPLADARVELRSGKPVFAVDAERLGSLAPPQPAPQTLGSHLLKAQITAPEGGDVGDIEDLAVNLRSGRLHFAVGRFSSNWVQEGLLVALPVRPLQAMRDGERFAMRFGLNELNTAYFFPENRWPDLNDAAVRAQIDRHVSR